MFKTALLGVAVGSVGIAKGLWGGSLQVSWVYYGLLQAYYSLPTHSLLVQASYRFTVELLSTVGLLGLAMGSLQACYWLWAYYRLAVGLRWDYHRLTTGLL